MDAFQFSNMKSKSRYLVWKFSLITCARRQLTQQVRIHDHSAKRTACVPQQRDQPACFSLSTRYRVGRTGAGDSQFLDHVCLYAATPSNMHSKLCWEMAWLLAISILAACLEALNVSHTCLSVSRNAIRLTSILPGLASSSTSRCSCSAITVVGAYSMSRLWLFDRLISSQATVSRSLPALYLCGLRVSRGRAGEMHRGKYRLHPTGSCIVGDVSGHDCQCHLPPYSMCASLRGTG